MPTKFLFILLIYCCLCLFSCSESNKSLSLEFDLPIEDSLHLNLFNLTASEPVYDAYIKENKLSLDSLPYGIYLLNLSWKRDFISVGEFKRLRPNTINLNKEHVVQKLIFVDSKEGTDLRLHSDKNLIQDDIEYQLYAKDEIFELKTDVKKGTLAKMYDEYEQIIYRNKVRYIKQTDSLKKVLYRLNDQGDFEQSKKINQQMKTLWEDKIVPETLEQERQFLIAHKEEVIIPFILMLRVTNKESYLDYKEVIEQLPDSFKKLKSIERLQSFSAQ